MDQQQWEAAVFTAWIETRMEADRTLVALSGGGVGLLVTLLVTVGAGSVWMLPVYGVAFASFMFALRAGIQLFKANAEHLDEAFKSPKSAHENIVLRNRLRSLDVQLEWAFWIGVWFSVAVGVLTLVTNGGST
jgi:hypothetical protein